MAEQRWTHAIAMDTPGQHCSTGPKDSCLHFWQGNIDRESRCTLFECFIGHEDEGEEEEQPRYLRPLRCADCIAAQKAAGGGDKWTHTVEIGVCGRGCGTEEEYCRGYWEEGPMGLTCGIFMEPLDWPLDWPRDMPTRCPRCLDAQARQANATSVRWQWSTDAWVCLHDVAFSATDNPPWARLQQPCIVYDTPVNYETARAVAAAVADECGGTDGLCVWPAEEEEARTDG